MEWLLSELEVMLSGCVVCFGYQREDLNESDSVWVRVYLSCCEDQIQILEDM